MNEGKFVDDEIVNKIIKNIIYDPNKKNKLFLMDTLELLNKLKI